MLKYEFSLVDIGSAGRQRDRGILNNSALGAAIENDLLNFPPPEPISGFNKRFLCCR